MLIEQSEAITTNMSKIARLKTRGGLVSHPNEYAPVATEFNEVFGGEHLYMSWHWFIPLPVHFPEWAIDNIMGYEEPSDEDDYDEDGIVGPYREPSVTDDGESNSITTRSSMGISSLMLGDDGAVGGGGTNGSSSVHGLMAFDVEEGNKIQQQQQQQQQQQHESTPHDDANMIITPIGERREEGIKKRTNNGSPLPLV
jgi:hypothetical protein